MPTLAPNETLQLRRVGDRVRWRRLDRGIPQRDRAARLGLGASAIYEIERAKRSIRISQLYELADELDCTVEYLLGITEAPDDAGGNSWSLNHGRDPCDASESAVASGSSLAALAGIVPDSPRALGARPTEAKARRSV